jgi:hypothetical protein
LICRGFSRFCRGFPAFRDFRALNNSPALGAVADRLEGGEFVGDAGPGLGAADLGGALDISMVYGRRSLPVVSADLIFGDT